MDVMYDEPDVSEEDQLVEHTISTLAQDSGVLRTQTPRSASRALRPRRRRDRSRTSRCGALKGAGHGRGVPGLLAPPYCDVRAVHTSYRLGRPIQCRFEGPGEPAWSEPGSGVAGCVRSSSRSAG
jgi:hypothetical protein